LNLIKPFFSKLGLSAVLVLFFMGCVSFTQKVTYTPTQNKTKIFDSRIGKIYVFPFEDKLETPTLIKVRSPLANNVTHVSETPLKTVIYQGIQKELQQIGLILAENVEESSGYIKGALNTFETNMTPGQVFSNKAELDIGLYSSQTQKVIWRESIEAITKDSYWVTGDGFLPGIYNKNIKKLIHRVVDNPDFQDAVIKLSKQ
jgi:hypothetical protein